MILDLGMGFHAVCLCGAEQSSDFIFFLKSVKQRCLLK